MIKRLALISLAILPLFPILPVLADDAELEAVRAKMAAMFDAIDAENVNEGPIDGWYEIHKSSIIAYVSEDGRFLLQGDLIDLDAGVNLSEAARSSARQELMAGVSEDQMIVFTPKEAKHTVTVFTDIDCTYCRRLHGQIDEYLDRGIEVRYMLYPRNGPASRSWITSEDVWCASNRNSALTAAKLDRDFETHKCNSSVVTNHYSIGQDIGLSGTPAILFDDGSLVSGYLTPEALAMRLEHKLEAGAATE